MKGAATEASPVNRVKNGSRTHKRKSLKLFVLEQRLRLRSGKYDAYLNQVRQKGVERDNLARLGIAQDLLREPEFSRMRSWAEYQRLRNAQDGQNGG